MEELKNQLAAIQKEKVELVSLSSRRQEEIAKEQESKLQEFEDLQESHHKQCALISDLLAEKESLTLSLQEMVQEKYEYSLLKEEEMKSARSMKDDLVKENEVLKTDIGSIALQLSSPNPSVLPLRKLTSKYSFLDNKKPAFHSKDHWILGELPISGSSHVCDIFRPADAFGDGLLASKWMHRVWELVEGSGHSESHIVIPLIGTSESGKSSTLRRLLGADLVPHRSMSHALHIKLAPCLGMPQISMRMQSENGSPPKQWTSSSWSSPDLGGLFSAQQTSEMREFATNNCSHSMVLTVNHPDLPDIEFIDTAAWTRGQAKALKTALKSPALGVIPVLVMSATEAINSNLLLDHLHTDEEDGDCMGTAVGVLCKPDLLVGDCLSPGSKELSRLVNRLLTETKRDSITQAMPYIMLKNCNVRSPHPSSVVSPCGVNLFDFQLEETDSLQSSAATDAKEQEFFFGESGFGELAQELPNAEQFQSSCMLGNLRGVLSKKCFQICKQASNSHWPRLLSELMTSFKGLVAHGWEPWMDFAYEPGCATAVLEHACHGVLEAFGSARSDDKYFDSLEERLQQIRNSVPSSPSRATPLNVVPPQDSDHHDALKDIGRRVVDACLDNDRQAFVSCVCSAEGSDHSQFASQFPRLVEQLTNHYDGCMERVHEVAVGEILKNVEFLLG